MSARAILQLRNSMTIMAGMKHHTKPWVGRWLNAVRIKKGIEATAIAAKLNIHPSNVARRECGDQRIVSDDIPVVLHAYGLTLVDYAKQAEKEGVVPS